MITEYRHSTKILRLNATEATWWKSGNWIMRFPTVFLLDASNFLSQTVLCKQL